MLKLYTQVRGIKIIISVKPELVVVVTQFNMQQCTIIEL